MSGLRVANAATSIPLHNNDVERAIYWFMV